MADISYIIRTKNAGKVIWNCLKAIRDIVLPPGLESEIIVIDNESSDRTVEKAKPLASHVVGFLEARPHGIYSPGAALNVGIEMATGNSMIILSSHCLPDKNLVMSFSAALSTYSTVCRTGGRPMDLAGMYGRQVPHASLSDDEKVELLTLFPNEWNMQTNNPFFHNGNSFLLKSAWSLYPFNEQVKTLEDREWAFRIQRQSGGKILYLPSAMCVRLKPYFHREYSQEALAVLENTA